MRLRRIRPDLTDRLATALTQHAAGAGVAATSVSGDREDWASVTMIGARHRLVLGCDADDRRDRWLAALPEADILLPGHYVADLVVESRTPSTVTMTVLTIIAT